jgi:hypothetical protein
MDSPGSCLSSLPVHLEPARRELLSWLFSDNPDEEKCYKLLRDMEVINEDGYFAYDDSDPLADLSGTASDVLAPPASLCNDKRPMEPSHQEDGQKIKKNKTWGPTHGTRQSSRTQGNAGKTIMDLAKENKKKQNLEVPVPSFKGITSANPFSMLQSNVWVVKAKQVGIVIDDIDHGGTDESVPPCAVHSENVLNVDLPLVNFSVVGEKAPEGMPAHHVSHNCLDVEYLPSPRTPSCAEVLGRELEDSDLLWTKICRNRRGKHPRTRKSP